MSKSFRSKINFTKYRGKDKQIAAGHLCLRDQINLVHIQPIRDRADVGPEEKMVG